MTSNEAERGIGPGDEVIDCMDCVKQFVWTKGEQAYFALNALSAPKRCKPCRVAKRALRDARF